MFNYLSILKREKLRCLNLGKQTFMYMNERLVVPKIKRPVSKSSFQCGHPGKKSMLATVSNVWWPKVHREVVAIAKNCPRCSEAGKNTKNVLCQKLDGKLPTAQKTTKKLPSLFRGRFRMHSML